MVPVGKGAESSCRAWPDLETGSQSGGISGSDPTHRRWWPPRDGGRRENAILFLARTSFATGATVYARYSDPVPHRLGRIGIFEASLAIALANGFTLEEAADVVEPG